MGDVFNEQIVKRNPRIVDHIKRAALIAAVFTVFYLALLVAGGLAFFIAAAAGCLAFYLMSFLNVEYEYIYTNGELDIDIIYNRARRKRLLSVSVKDFEVMAHVDDKERQGSFGGAQETLFCHSGETGPNTYAFLTIIKGKKTQVVFEPNEKLLKAIGTSLSRQKLYIKR